MNLRITPFKWLKSLMPKSLFGRTLIIIIAPVLMVQALTSYIFIDRHLEKVTDLLAKNIANKVAVAVDIISPHVFDPEHFLEVVQYIKLTLDIEVDFVPTDEQFPLRKTPTLGYTETYLKNALEERVGKPSTVRIEEEDVLIRVQDMRGLFLFKEKTKHLFPKTTSILMWWAVLAPILFLCIAVLFMRNQIRPLRRLSEAVKSFGREEGDTPLKPAGSFEVRRLTYAFNAMRERIKRQMEQRFEMLAGISHDLRTPLTRMELQLAMMGDKKEIKALQEDVRDMSRLVGDFLAFAKGEKGEALQETSLHDLMQKVLGAFPSSKIVYLNEDHSVVLPLRRDSFSRCLTNLLENALKYGTHAWVKVERGEEAVRVTVEDDGPGIPEEERLNVFKPFYRMESSRNSETGGTGLGLSIARDAIHTHGGEIHLSESSKGGLQVILVLPC